MLREFAVQEAAAAAQRHAGAKGTWRRSCMLHRYRVGRVRCTLGALHFSKARG
eukprot:CAMPEP_0179168630 /NCGR_PEP_ID=MMETSP0796-20121207/82958_1 /TAXON_ID=73915 /ORGANISM="Pyrodinium bahamense, Strain pbaha01" /LENGTH=52 /DNA_ID=CAMNT_0020871405 /DNA_START=37 /DNA_END=191 /DNA_ORIENTATION=+